VVFRKDPLWWCRSIAPLSVFISHFHLFLFSIRFSSYHHHHRDTLSPCIAFPSLSSTTCFAALRTYFFMTVTSHR